MKLNRFECVFANLLISSLFRNQSAPTQRKTNTCRDKKASIERETRDTKIQGCVKQIHLSEQREEIGWNSVDIS